MKREKALAVVRIAAYHNDMKTATRTLIENRISRKAYDEALSLGLKQRASGMKCSCWKCNEPKETK